MTQPAAWPHLFHEGAAGTPILLLLHGTGGTEHDLLPLVERIAPGAGYLAPRGPVQENGMNRWFRRFGEGVFDVDDVARRAGELAEFIQHSHHTYGLADRPLIAVGLSNGANIALAAALLQPTTVPAVVAFSGMYPLEGRTVDADLQGSSVALFNGRQDPLAPFESVTRLHSVLQSRGAEVTLTAREGGHGIHPTDVTGAAAWITSTTRKEQP